MKGKVIYLYNRHAGRGIPASEIADNIDELTRMGYLVTAVPSQKHMDYAKVLLDCGEGRLICSGGDGMLNAMVNVLYRMQKEGQIHEIKTEKIPENTKLSEACKVKNAGTIGTCEMKNAEKTGACKSEDTEKTRASEAKDTRKAGACKTEIAGKAGECETAHTARADAPQLLPIGYIPAGTTNDFARSIGIPVGRALHEVLAAAVEGPVRRVDAGMLNGRCFVYVAAFGALTNISYVTSQDIKNALGYFAYVLRGIRELPEIRTTHVRMTLEHEGKTQVIEDDFVVGMITNSASVAGFRSIGSADYSCDDGLFEIALLKMPAGLAQIQAVLAAMRDGKADADCIVYAQSSHVTIEAQEEIAYTLDGEYGGSFVKADITNMHKMLAVRVPEAH